MEPPQYNGGLLGLQKREYLTRKETDVFKEDIVDLISNLNFLNLKKIIFIAATEPFERRGLIIALNSAEEFDPASYLRNGRKSTLRRKNSKI